MALRKFIIDRDIPKAGTVGREQLRQAAANEVLNLFGSDIQWLQSFAAGGKTFGVYLAEDETVIRQHAEIGGFSPTRITEVSR